MEMGSVPFPNPYAYAAPVPPSLVHHYQYQDQYQYQPVSSTPPTIPLPPLPAGATHYYTDVDPLVQQTQRLSFIAPEQDRGRGRAEIRGSHNKEAGMERRMSVSGIVARFRKRSRSRSRSATRDSGRNLLDDE